ncbi:hypothetical protein SAMN04489844_0081 [Nocardioides exalbidus]|uniref:Lysylphosphatidylglycerol synthase TM region n=1 Tax=Nocardioides exalbidus TaxID=402596 RepID=A0A1H4I3H3_9ACTN|nr:lysylphosphatidylglycerol synthase domain-containing protein [Nocardioides exalbidus]SEB28647.1 hypothetical protein SAMN04489844_0081 [Nocardioides exalbidus]
MTRRRALQLARVLFVLLTLTLAWWGFRGRWDEIGDAASGTGPLRLAGAVLCAVAGLALTGVLWRLLLRWLGSEVGPRDAAAVFFVGQLGKYVPGSVWSVAVQAQLGRRHDVPARSSVAASSLFLLVHTATGLLVGGALAVLGAVDLPAEVSPLWGWAALLVGAASLSPPLLRLLADRLAGHGVRAALGPAEVARSVALMALVWLAYGASLLLLVTGRAAAPSLLAAAAAFALAHAVGVLVVFAPAGVGAREAVLVALLAPVLGVPGAVAVALLSRVAHAVADFLLALLASTAAGLAAPSRHAGEPAGVRGR